MESIVHICGHTEWKAAQHRGIYSAPSLESDGFIHASRPEQILHVANTFYPGVTNLVLLWIDVGSLEAELRWEMVDGEIFPHIYGPINLNAVNQITSFAPDSDGIFRHLPESQ